MLWVTPQGRFVDVRERPLVFKPGLAALAAKVPGGCTVLPLAIEYVFWDERLPEALMQFGEPIVVHEAGAHGAGDEGLEQRLEEAMFETMESLKAKAMKRDAREFAVLQEGGVGDGRLLRAGTEAGQARLRGRRYQREHTAVSIAPVPLVQREETRMMLAGGGLLAVRAGSGADVYGELEALPGPAGVRWGFRAGGVSVLIPARNEAAGIGDALRVGAGKPGSRVRSRGDGRRLDRWHGWDRARTCGE